MTTKHTCGGPVFGKKTVGCPRCDELLAGAAPIQWAPKRPYDGAASMLEIRSHFDSHRHVSGGCGPVCTFGEW